AVEPALADGKTDPAEAKELEKLLDPATAKALAAATKDGKVTPDELAKIKAAATKAADGADTKGLPEDGRKALADGKISAEERTALEKTLSAADLKLLDAATKDGKVDDKELAKLGATISEKNATDPKAAASSAAKDAKAGASAVDANGNPVPPKIVDGKAVDNMGKDAVKDAKAGAVATADNKTTAAAVDAKAGAAHPGVVGSSGDTPPGGDKAGSKPAATTTPVPPVVDKKTNKAAA
ncbi:MAG: hypothetical protein H7123_00225, partial [Thermoleophilia bacterium]|nr:hypothetical protein [Thermoleophilia bacterium]